GRRISSPVRTRRTSPRSSPPSPVAEQKRPAVAGAWPSARRRQRVRHAPGPAVGARSRAAHRRQTPRAPYAAGEICPERAGTCALTEQRFVLQAFSPLLRSPPFKPLSLRPNRPRLESGGPRFWGESPQGVARALSARARQLTP